MRAVCWALLLMLSSAAQAADVKTGRVAPESATSSCLGANTSPTCMTETLLACFARGEAALGRSAGIADPRGVQRTGTAELVYAAGIFLALLVV